MSPTVKEYYHEFNLDEGGMILRSMHGVMGHSISPEVANKVIKHFLVKVTEASNMQLYGLFDTALIVNLDQSLEGSG